MSTVGTVGNNAHWEGVPDKAIGSETIPNLCDRGDAIVPKTATFDSRSILGPTGTEYQSLVNMGDDEKEQRTEVDEIIIEELDSFKDLSTIVSVGGDSLTGGGVSSVGVVRGARS